MKKALSLLLIFATLLGLSGCDFGSKRITNVSEYGQVESYLALPDFFPASVEDYEVHAYAYHLESWMDTCYELFLDITVTQEQFDTLLSDFIQQGQEAWYASGYYEIVFEDFYDVYEKDGSGEQVVGFADIEKIIYNPELRRIVFVALHANDTGVYPLKDVAYFNRFGIDEIEYAAHIAG